MPRSSKRTRHAEGIYRDDLGFEAVVKVGTVQRGKRFPPGTDLKAMKQWREAERVQLRAVALVSVRGTFTAEARRYLGAVRGALDKATFRSRRSELRAWCAAFGHEQVRHVDTLKIRQAIGTWRHADISPKTIQNRVRTFGHLWRTLYKQNPPLEGIDLPKIQKRRPLFVTPDTIKKVEAALRQFERDGRLRDSRQRARFMVIATTGVRPAQLKRTKPEEVDLRRRVWTMQAAKGGEPVGLYLNDEMLAAWKTFALAQAWGHFDTRGFGRVLRAAGWPKDVRPYNLRHAVGIELGERGVDFRTIADMLGHTDDTTTRAFYVPALNSNLRRASEALSGRLGWLAPKAGTVKTRKKRKAKSARAKVS